jgi:hypothetical protein
VSADAGDEREAAPEPESVITAFGLAGQATAWTAVGGAWSNKVFRLETGGRAFAVKEMRNPWRIERWQAWLAQSWSFELLAIEAGVAAPQPVANPATGGCLAWVSTTGDQSARMNATAGSRRDPSRRRQTASSVPVRVHHWVRGRACAPAAVSPDVARWAGKLLATLHGLAIKPADRTMFPVLTTDNALHWPELTEAAGRSGADWAALMPAVTPSVSVVAELARSSGYRPDEEVMSHGDIDQKNLIVTSSGPVLCDWDLAMPLAPRRELAVVAMSLACWRDERIAREVVRAYRAHGGDDTEIAPSDLGWPLMSGIDWTVFNIERVLGQRPATPAEVALAAHLVPELLGLVRPQVDCALRIADILRI